MKKIVFVLSVILVSCSGGEKKLPGTEKKETSEKDTVSAPATTIDTVEIDASLPGAEKAKLLQNKYTEAYGKTETDKSIFPERFESEWSLKFHTAQPAGEFYFSGYKDSSGMQNVMNNWLNCFGNDCIAVKENETRKGMKNSQCLVIFNEKEIIYFGYSCEIDETMRQSVIAELKALFGNKKSKYLGIYCNGVLKWG